MAVLLNDDGLVCDGAILTHPSKHLTGIMEAPSMLMSWSCCVRRGLWKPTALTLINGGSTFSHTQVCHHVRFGIAKTIRSDKGQGC